LLCQPASADRGPLAGNHELYVTDIAYETFSQFSKVYGERYLTSNVQIINPATGKFEYIGAKYRYFTTKHGIPQLSKTAKRAYADYDSRAPNHGLRRLI